MARTAQRLGSAALPEPARRPTAHRAQVRPGDKAQPRRAGAEIAAAALDHAADAWTGDAKVEQWLRARADHIIELGYYDGEEWPSEPTVNDA
ncbi:hypothetical protein [Brevibacterium linens]|uniref:hypothetical protein n=1 Tax=Brevibacterium linens TaxID=1703 RepID=UPI0011AF9F69|nr:hypothetical protein [Brevibacterium linens]